MLLSKHIFQGIASEVSICCTSHLCLALSKGCFQRSIKLHESQWVTTPLFSLALSTGMTEILVSWRAGWHVRRWNPGLSVHKAKFGHVPWSQRFIEPFWHPSLILLFTNMWDGTPPCFSSFYLFSCEVVRVSANEDASRLAIICSQERQIDTFHGGEPGPIPQEVWVANSSFLYFYPVHPHILPQSPERGAERHHLWLHDVHIAAQLKPMCLG